MLLLSVTLCALSAFNYGFSDQAFASCQAMDSFTRQFGEYDKETKTWKLQPMFISLYNSLKAGTQIIGATHLCLTGKCLTKAIPPRSLRR